MKKLLIIFSIGLTSCNSFENNINGKYVLIENAPGAIFRSFDFKNDHLVTVEQNYTGITETCEYEVANNQIIFKTGGYVLDIYDNGTLSFGKQGGIFAKENNTIDKNIQKSEETTETKKKTREDSLVEAATTVYISDSTNIREEEKVENDSNNSDELNIVTHKTFDSNNPQNYGTETVYFAFSENFITIKTKDGKQTFKVTNQRINEYDTHFYDTIDDNGIYYEWGYRKVGTSIYVYCKSQGVDITFGDRF